VGAKKPKRRKRDWYSVSEDTLRLFFILIVTAVGSSSRWVVVVIIGLIFTPVVSRTVRAAVLAETELDYVQAARLRGERSPYIMFSEILPNVLPVVVEFTVGLATQLAVA
jgi:peptide/nickel transport system permease protein